ncbi:MAG: hypothetical protein KatS3mg081_0022 [Gemmatimonadales bacterium]|nr:MAG: hypothetical protein KatS3mg081_0022 [Gemmatimonadales bacterium]
MELLIVGDGPERPKLEALAKQLLPRTRFLGHLERQELALCFAGADLFVLPGTGGLAVQEAMTYGKPVIVGPGDGTEADLVKEGKNGFHVTPGDITCLSEIISRCLSNWEALRQMGEESRRIVEKEYNLDVTVQAFLEAIDYVLTRREV